jgi:hypothetical protein
MPEEVLEEAVAQSSEVVAPIVDSPEVAQDVSSDSVVSYEVPEAYKDKPWAADIKSQDDLWNKLDAVNKPFSEYSDEERSAYFERMRPETPEAYTFSQDIDPAEKDLVAKIFHENGLTVEQGNKVAQQYNKAMFDAVAEHYSPEGLEEQFKGIFGTQWESKSKDVLAFAKQGLSEDERKIFDGAPNQLLGLVVKQMAKIKEQYGISDKGTQLSGQGVSPAIDYDKQIADVYTELDKLVKAPYTTSQKQELVDKLTALNLAKHQSKQGK